MTYCLRSVDRSVFRAYDIRGLVDIQLDEDAFYSIGCAISTQLYAASRQEIFVARDGRLSSERLLNAVKQGLIDHGITVIDLGAVATPVMYYATCVQHVDSGLIVTGSHNPAEYNGIKVVIAGKTLVQSDIDLLYEAIETRLFNSPIKKGAAQSLSIVESYTQRILADIKLSRPLKVVIDCGNGIAGPIIPQIIAELGCEVIPLYCEVDGRFPNHHPDPSVEDNLADLKARIKSEKADIGFAFDGDADRLGLVTNEGEVIWPDRFLILYARELLKKHPGGIIVYDVKCSSHLADEIKALGGIGIMSPTGHSIVKGLMKKEKAILAGEMSGHIFFKDRWYGFDDALYSACRLLEILSLSEASVSEQFSVIPNSVNTPEIKIPIAEEEKFNFMQKFSQYAQFPSSQRITIDGLRVEFEYGWGLIRASNTTPYLIARFEAKDQHYLKEIQTLFKLQLHALNDNLEVSF